MATRVLIIGAGLGGIATAGRLARQGFDVTVVDKRSCPGGRCDVLERDGFRFDTGPTLFLMPAVFEETFAAMGERLADHLDLVRLDPTYRVHFRDGTHLDITADLVCMREQLERIERGAFDGMLRFAAAGYRFYEMSLQHFVGRNFYTFFEHFSPANVGLVLRLKALTKHFPFTSRFFRDPRLRAAFSFQNMYLGLSPFEAPATYALLQYTELAEGVWVPRGGMYEAVKAFVRIAQGLGVRFHYDAAVRRIDLDGERARGVELESGERLNADVVVANADLPYVYQALLPDDGTTAKLERKRYSSSTLMFYWGLEGERPDGLLHHNVFLADHRYRESFDDIFHHRTLPRDPSFYVCSPGDADEPAAPPGHYGMIVLVPVGHLDERTPQDWTALNERARKAVLAGLARIGLSDVDRRIRMEATIGPPDWKERYNLTKGAAFGLNHNFWQVGYLRPHNRHRRYRNLYFVGASTHPGTGLPIVLLSSRLVVERILKEQGAPAAGRVTNPGAAGE